MAEQLKFYTYIHLRADDNKVFYVGKGQGKRAWALKNRKAAWKGTVAKHDYKVEVCSRFADEKEALEHEKFLIACFRDTGAPLVNLTSGGQGTSGLAYPKEGRKKLSECMKRMHAENPQLAKGHGQRVKAQWQDPEIRAKRLAARKEQK